MSLTNICSQYNYDKNMNLLRGASVTKILADYIVFDLLVYTVCDLQCYNPNLFLPDSPIQNLPALVKYI